MLLLHHQTEVLAVGECNEFFGQHQHPYLDAVQELFLCQVLGVGIHPIDEVLNLMDECMG